jgi:ABC-2 type transport system ATP-binding protein
VKSLNAAGVTVIYTSHYMEEVQKLCKRIAILDAGKLLACDTLPDLLKLLDAVIRISARNAPSGFAEQLRAIAGVKAVEALEGFKLTVDDAAVVLARILHVCNAAGVELTAVSTREPTLERVFLHLTGRELRD